MRLVAVAATALVLAACSAEPVRDGPAPNGDGPAPNGDLQQVPGVFVHPDYAALSPEGDRIAVTCDGELCLWDTADGRLLDRWPVGAVVAWSASDVIATTDTSGGRASIELVDASTRDPLGSIDAHDVEEGQDMVGRGVRALAFSSDGDLMASAGSDGAVRLWTVPEGEAAGELELECEEPGALAFAPDDPVVAVGCADAPAEVWDASTLERLATLDVEPQQGLAWRGDGGVLATASHAPGDEATVRLWETADWTMAAESPEAVEAGRLAFDPSGERLAMSVKGEREVRVWTIASGDVERLSGASDQPRAVLWSRDGASVYAVSGRDGVLAWSGEAGDVRKFELPD